MAIHSIRRRTAENWATLNPVLSNGKVGLEKDTGLFKWGDGKTAWKDLPYANKQSVVAAVNDGKLSIYQGGVLQGTFSANQAGDATLNLDAAPAVGNGTLTVNQGGALKGTFSANQAGNMTVNLDFGITFPIIGGRLSVASGVCVPTADMASANTLYYVPGDAVLGGHNTLSVPNATQDGWNLIALGAQLSLSLSGVAVGVYDVFAYQNNGNPYLDIGPAWTNTTTRSMALATLQGTPVNKVAMTTKVNGHSIPANGAIWLGIIYVSAVGTIVDTQYTRSVANAYNTVTRLASAYAPDTTRSVPTTPREFNGGTGLTRGQFVVAIPQMPLMILTGYSYGFSPTTGSLYLSVMLDSAFLDSTYFVSQNSYINMTVNTIYPWSCGLHQTSVGEWANAVVSAGSAATVKALIQV